MNAGGSRSKKPRDDEKKRLAWQNREGGRNSIKGGGFSLQRSGEGVNEKLKGPPQNEPQIVEKEKECRIERKKSEMTVKIEKEGGGTS